MKQYPGYTLVKREDCPEQHGTLTVLTHDVSGATVLLVENPGCRSGACGGICKIFCIRGKKKGI